RAGVRRPHRRGPADGRGLHASPRSEQGVLMSTLTSSAGLSFSQLVFSDLERYRPGLPTSWPRVLVQCVGHPGMVASIILRAQQKAHQSGRIRLAFVLRSVGMYLFSADFVPGM